MNNPSNLSIFDRIEGFTIALVSLMFPVLTMSGLL
jgi:hypothetical protein